MSLTIAIPTIGRPTLARCLFSFIDQLHDGDEVIIVADRKGDTDYAKFVYQLGTKRNGVNWRFTVHGDPNSGWGQAQRNKAYDLADDRNHVWCLSDDDVATSGALDAIRDSINRSSGQGGGQPWFIFRVGRGTSVPWVWQTTEVRVGNLDADCIVAPSAVKVRWGLDYEGDARFAHALVAELGQPWFASDLIAVTTPSGDYLADHYAAMMHLQPGFDDSGLQAVMGPKR